MLHLTNVVQSHPSSDSIHRQHTLALAILTLRTRRMLSEVGKVSNAICGVASAIGKVFDDISGFFSAIGKVFNAIWFVVSALDEIYTVMLSRIRGTVSATYYAALSTLCGIWFAIYNAMLSKICWLFSKSPTACCP